MPVLQARARPRPVPTGRGFAVYTAGVPGPGTRGRPLVSVRYTCHLCAGRSRAAVQPQGGVAQLAEHSAHNRVVVGSSPTAATRQSTTEGSYVAGTVKAVALAGESPLEQPGGGSSAAWLGTRNGSR